MPRTKREDRVPAGFVPLTDDEVNPEGESPAEFIKGWETREFDKIPATLYTDRCGTNLFTIVINGETYAMTLRTD